MGYSKSEPIFFILRRKRSLVFTGIVYILVYYDTVF